MTSNYTISSPNKKLDELAALHGELDALRQEQADLQLLLETTVEHSDNIEAELQAQMQAAERQAQRLALLNAMSQQMNLATREAELFDLTARYAVQVFAQANRTSIVLLTADRAHFEIIAVQGAESNAPHGLVFPLQGSTLAQAIEQRQLLVYHDATGRQMPGLRMWLSAPLFAGGQPIGCLNLGSEQENAFDANDQQLLLQMAALLASCVENRRLFAQVQTALDLERSYRQQEMLLRQSEKLATLGRLSAGMAHELNNPAAAAQRGAEQLRLVIDQTQQAHSDLHRLALTPAQLAWLTRLEQVAQHAVLQPTALDALERSDQESSIESWLADQGVEGGWEFAPTLVSLGYTLPTLRTLWAGFSRQQAPLVIAWLHGVYTIHSLLAEIREGAGRITAIVKALKAYVYLDQAPVQAVDVQEGLENTLVMLRSRLKLGVTVTRDYCANLPRIEAYGSELNQVWTNLIDNAIAAMQGQGALTLRTTAQADHIVVEISDNGPGIPPEIQGKIFDPFFTTKAPGEGTGLGLNISYTIITQKHQGAITVESQPGRTTFRVTLPVQMTR